MDSIVIPFFLFWLCQRCLYADAPPEEGGKGINWPIRLEIGDGMQRTYQPHPSLKPTPAKSQADRQHGLAFRGVGLWGSRA